MKKKNKITINEIFGHDLDLIIAYGYSYCETICNMWNVCFFDNTIINIESGGEEVQARISENYVIGDQHEIHNTEVVYWWNYSDESFEITFCNGKIKITDVYGYITENLKNDYLNAVMVED